MGGEYGAIPQTEQGATAAAAPASDRPSSLRAEFIGELIGTCILVQVGTAACCENLFLGTIEGMWQIAVVWIVAATLGIYAVGHLSGGHLNPAVTFSFAIVRPSDMSFGKMIYYWVAQVVGGLIGTLINMIIFYKSITMYENQAGFARGSPESIASASPFSDYYSLSQYTGGAFHAFILEAFGTAFLVFVVFAITNSNNNVPGSAVPPLVGVAIGAMVFTIGPFTNAGINPARDLGPRIALLFTGWGITAFTHWWVYLIAPLIGGPIGAMLADKLLFP